MIHRRDVFRKHFRDAAPTPIAADSHGDRYAGKHEQLQSRTGRSEGAVFLSTLLTRISASECS